MEDFYKKRKILIILIKISKRFKDIIMKKTLLVKESMDIIIIKICYLNNRQ